MEILNTPANKATAELESEHQALAQVRELLYSDDRGSVKDALDRLAIIESRISDPVARAKDLDEVIVSVMRDNLATERELRKVLKPVLVEQFHQTARDEPDVMAEALFPILGPAIRKMIGNLVSPDKNARKRKYRLEQLLLIDKMSGLPVSQISSDAVVIQDADMVSGMLSAIQSFVHDAFSADEFDGLNTLQVGELSVWIEWGPSAVLAAVVRGAPPQSLREAMQIYLEQLHCDHGESLSHYDGDSSQYLHLKPKLTKLLDNHDASLKNRYKHLSSKSKNWMIGFSALVLCSVGWFAYSTIDAKKWQQYVASLEAIPGVVIIDHERRFRDYQIKGLKDPRVIIPGSLITDADINPEFVSHRFEAYQALHPSFVLDAVNSLIDLPDGVSLNLEGSVLQISGSVGFSWLQNTRQKLSATAGIDRIVYLGSQ